VHHEPFTPGVVRLSDGRAPTSPRDRLEARVGRLERALATASLKSSQSLTMSRSPASSIGSASEVPGQYRGALGV